MVTGDEIRAANRALNERLAALGIFTGSREDLTPRLSDEYWEKLVSLAEAAVALYSEFSDEEGPG